MNYEVCGTAGQSWWLVGSARMRRAGGHWLWCLVLLAGAGCWTQNEKPTPANGSTNPKGMTTSTKPIDPQKAEQIEEFCSICHVAPRADYFPKHAWHDAVDRAFGFWVETGRSDVRPPAMADVVRYYRDRAPEKLEFPVPKRSDQPFGSRFERTDYDRASGENHPAIATVRWLKLNDDSPGLFVTCDMHLGEIRAFDPRRPADGGKTLGTGKNPCRSEAVDLDADGAIDLLVADLGSLTAADHHDGRVLWLKQSALEGTWRTIELVKNLGRTADMRAADFDGDGDLDVAVAEFGWHKTGSVFWLEAKDLAAEPPVFERHELDPRQGAIHLPIVDLNGDGKPDILALMSQDYEEVLAWINQGDGTFVRHVVSERQEPSFGSSGIEPVDLDGDGDLDLLYTNGDTFDSHLAKPYHGVQWLENTGTMPFKMHRLADMIGAYRAAAADLDGDGDQDIVVGGFLPEELVDRPPLDDHDSLVILEQTAPGKYARHALTQGRFNHTSLDVADFDGDGRPDIVVGHFQAKQEQTRPRISVWWNRGPARP